MLLLAAAAPSVAASDQDLDVCLEVASSAVAAEPWAQVVGQVEDVIAERSALFPSPTIVASRHDGLLGAAPASVGLHVAAGHPGSTSASTSATCLRPGLDWTARFTRSFLQAGAEVMLAQAPTTPGIDSSVTIEWFADEARLRTTLVFAGPFDIPNGTCWIDDVLSVDATRGLAIATGEQGARTSPFAEGACGRFFDHLPQGGAGEQAVTLLPVEVALATGGSIRFVVTELSVSDDAIEVGGTLESR